MSCEICAFWRRKHNEAAEAGEPEAALHWAMVLRRHIVREHGSLHGPATQRRARE